jgi:hypothetical protein
MSDRLSVRVEQLGSCWTDFHENWYLSIFRKSVEKIQVLFKSDKNNWHFRWRPRMRNVSDKSYRENQNMHFILKTFFSRKSCRFWDNVDKCGRARQATDDIIRRMRTACWISKATDTHWLYVLIIAFPLQQ